MGCSVAEAQERVDAWEFREWQHYYSLEPWGPAGDDARTLAATGVLARCMGAKRIRPEWILPWVSSRDPDGGADEASLRLKLSISGVKFVESTTPNAAGEGE